MKLLFLKDSKISELHLRTNWKMVILGNDWQHSVQKFLFFCTKPKNINIKMPEITFRWSKVSTSWDTECSVTPNYDGIPAHLRVWFNRKLWGLSEFYPFLLSKSVSSVLRINDATLQFWFNLFFPSYFHSFYHPFIHSFFFISFIWPAMNHDAYK
jgi:hypothetical protein